MTVWVFKNPFNSNRDTFIKRRIPELLAWMKSLQEDLHKPPSPTDMCVTTGSQEGLCKVPPPHHGIKALYEIKTSSWQMTTTHVMRFASKCDFCCWFQVFEMLVNPGDNVLLDAPTYSGTLAAVRALPLLKTHTRTHTRAHVHTHQCRKFRYFLGGNFSPTDWNPGAFKKKFGALFETCEKTFNLNILI